MLAGYHPSRRPVGTAYDRARIGTRTARTSPERISGPRLSRRGAQAGGGLPTIESCYRRFDRGLKNAIFAFQPPWYKFEMRCPREAQPDSPTALGARTGRPRAMWFWGGGGRQRPFSRKVGVAHAERLHGTWVGALSRGTASDAHESTGTPEQVVQQAESAFPAQDRPISGACAVLGPTRC